MGSEWRVWEDSSSWLIRETKLERGWLVEFKRPEKLQNQFNDGRCDVFVTQENFAHYPRTLLETSGMLSDPLLALALVYHYKEKYGERSEDGGVRSAGAEA